MFNVEKFRVYISDVIEFKGIERLLKFVTLSVWRVSKIHCAPANALNCDIYLRKLQPL